MSIARVRLKIAAGEEDDTRREERNFVEQIPVDYELSQNFHQ